MRIALGNGLVTAFRVVGAIATYARYSLVIGNLVKQARQHRRVAGRIVGHFDGPDFQHSRIDAKMDLAPLATVVGAVFLRLSFAFAEHLNAGAVDQKVQSCRCRLRPDRYRQVLLARLTVLKSGTCQSRPAGLSRLCDIPIA